jgi:CheY-like chemotaxis protein
MSKARVLVVDDDPEIKRQLSLLLRMDDYEVNIAGTGEEGLQRLAEGVPELVVLDMNMPGFGGMGFLNRLREMPAPNLPAIVVFTARTNLGEFFDGLEVAAYLTKPCEPEALLQTVEVAITRRRAANRKRAEAASGKAKVLIAGSDETHRRQAVNAFESAGYLVDTVSTGPDALEKAIAWQPHLLVAPLLLTGLNADRLAAQLGELPSTRALPIIVYNDSCMEAPRERYVNGKTGIKELIHSGDVQTLVAVARGLVPAAGHAR